MKKFWKESRTLTIALSLLLCCMIGVVWASDGCPEIDGTCASTWTLAHNWEIYTDDKKAEAEIECAYYLAYRTKITGCVNALHGWKNPPAWSEWYYGQATTAAATDNTAGNTDESSANAKNDLGCTRIDEGELLCVPGNDHWGAVAKYNVAFALFAAPNSGAHDLFEEAKGHYIDAINHLGNAEGVLAKHVWDIDEEEWVDCDCWE